MSLIGTHTLNPTTDPAELAKRAECAAAGHEPITYNPIHEATWCRCGVVVVAGDHGKTPPSRMPAGGWGSLCRLPGLMLALIVAAAALLSCGAPAPAPVAYDPNAYAITICVDRATWVRVLDNYCPLDDEPYPDHPFMWVYSEYSGEVPDIDVVYVGYQVERGRYGPVRPPRVATTNLDRGRFPETAAAPGAASVRVPSMPVERRTPSSSTVRRGGLGVPGARATNVPQPTRSLDSPAPGRASATRAPAAAPAQAAPPRAIPPRVPGPRPVTSGSTSRPRR